MTESVNWGKRLRMSSFVQAGRMSFANAKPEPIPEEQIQQKVFHILLRDGMFTHAKVILGDYGGRMWVHPALYLPGGKWGVFSNSEVVAWKEKN